MFTIAASKAVNPGPCVLLTAVLRSVQAVQADRRQHLASALPAASQAVPAQRSTLHNEVCGMCTRVQSSLLQSCSLISRFRSPTADFSAGQSIVADGSKASPCCL